jgi:hypothetical protein
VGSSPSMYTMSKLLVERGCPSKGIDKVKISSLRDLIVDDLNFRILGRVLSACYHEAAT